MKWEALESLSVWASLTGLLLVAILALRLANGLELSASLAMLLASVVGFELSLCGQGLVRRTTRRG